MWFRPTGYGDDRRPGRSVWSGGGVRLGFELARSIRDIILGTDPDVELTHRVVDRLQQIRDLGDPQVTEVGTLLAPKGKGTQWWTFAGSRANESLAAALGAGGVEATAGPLSVICRGSVGVAEVRACGSFWTTWMELRPPSGCPLWTPMHSPGSSSHPCSRQRSARQRSRNE